MNIKNEKRTVYDDRCGSIHKGNKCFVMWFRSHKERFKWWVVADEYMEPYVMDDFGNLTWIEG